MRASPLAALAAIAALGAMVSIARHHDHVLALEALEVPSEVDVEVVPERAELASIEAMLAPVELNTASAADLERLPRIGPALAARIIENRPYARIEDLERVRGIGPRTIESLRPHVVVRP